MPARDDFGSLECGQPNWSMKSGMTRWKWRPKAKDEESQRRAARCSSIVVAAARTVVEAGVGEIDEVASGDGHLVEVDLALDLTHGGVESRDWVRHVDGLTVCYSRRAATPSCSVSRVFSSQ